ncbi:cytidine deaminase [Actinobaculum suis]|uniref:Cytidine deaminase n=1 Tax=Actinobaculum suis TaxID=1657 RepID=A0A1G6ZN54_9ACTO|nr:cytidine deaminase [Actinobaculum suis]MDY5154007.1 cytidine deaminase [Actinobaculum suis]SDE02976.1 cytidine deaminase [Actinobaculum suis]
MVPAVNSPEVGAEVWEKLHAEAVEAMRTAYCPYSGFPVGAAALATDGRIYTGANVENASYPCGLCAECGLVSSLVRAGGGRLVAFTCVDGRERATVPCGRCRQLLHEHGGPEMLLKLPGGIAPLKEILPQAFGPSDLLDFPNRH